MQFLFTPLDTGKEVVVPDLDLTNLNQVKPGRSS